MSKSRPLCEEEDEMCKSTPLTLDSWCTVPEQFRMRDSSGFCFDIREVIDYIHTQLAYKKNGKHEPQWPSNPWNRQEFSERDILRFVEFAQHVDVPVPKEVDLLATGIHKGLVTGDDFSKNYAALLKANLSDCRRRNDWCIARPRTSKDWCDVPEERFLRDSENYCFDFNELMDDFKKQLLVASWPFNVYSGTRFDDSELVEIVEHARTTGLSVPSELILLVIGIAEGRFAPSDNDDVFRKKFRKLTSLTTEKLFHMISDDNWTKFGTLTEEFGLKLIAAKLTIDPLFLIVSKERVHILRGLLALELVDTSTKFTVPGHLASEFGMAPGQETCIEDFAKANNKRKVLTLLQETSKGGCVMM